MSKAKTMKQRCAERPLKYMPTGVWWLLTNYGTPWGVFTSRANAIQHANFSIDGIYERKSLPENCELRRVAVKVLP